MKARKTSNQLKFAVAFLLGLVCGVLGYHLFQLPRSHGGEFQVDVGKWLENSGSTIPIVAVSSGENPVGVMCTLAVKIKAGEGYVYVSVDPTLVGFDFQDSERKAIKVAGTLAGYPLDEDGIGLKGYDIYFLVAGPGKEKEIRVEAIDGPSAGAAITVALLSVLENRRIREGYVITGTIEEDGKIGQVGGIFYKALAAAKKGATHFLVPKGQSKVTIYEQVTYEPLPGWRWITYRPKLVDLSSYLREKGWNLQVLEVSRIEEAVALMLE
ncbi:MAG: S16 family serine protease [Candidatus Hadarchaeales archaeon]